MAKSTYSFRISDERNVWLDEAAAKLGTTKSGLLEDALLLAAHTNDAAVANFGSMLKEIAAKYGEDAVLMGWVDQDAEGRPVAHVLINGEEKPDVRGHVTVDEERGRAHLFVEFTGWSMVAYGSSYVGPTMMATLPIRAAVSFSWPPEGPTREAAVATLGELIHGGTRVRELAEL